MRHIIILCALVLMSFGSAQAQSGEPNESPTRNEVYNSSEWKLKYNDGLHYYSKRINDWLEQRVIFSKDPTDPYPTLQVFGYRKGRDGYNAFKTLLDAADDLADNDVRCKRIHYGSYIYRDSIENMHIVFDNTTSDTILFITFERRKKQ